MSGNLSNIFGGPWTPPAHKDPDTPEVQLRNAIIGAGYSPPSDIKIDGNIHRFSTDGKPKGDSGWYIAFDGAFPAGAFGCWKEMTTTNWKAETDRDISAADQIVISRRMSEARALRDAELKKTQVVVADVAGGIWENCLAASPDHPYLIDKNIQPNGTRVTSDGRLVVPMYDGSGEIACLQYINHKGDKAYSTGAKVSDARWLIGPETGRTIYLVEGFATGASVHEATDSPTYLAFSTGGLSVIAGELRAKFGELQDIVIVADNDDSGAGLKYGQAAADAHNCRLIMPPRIDGFGVSGTDANDFAKCGDLLALLIPPTDDWLVSADDFANEPKPVRWLIKKWLQDEAFMMVHGPSGGGKTFVVLDWCMRIASTLEEWNGCKVKNGSVLYLAGEGHHGLRSRIAAWKIHNQQPTLNMWLSKSGCDLNTPDGYKRVSDSIRNLGELPRLIVVDTLHRFLNGNENDTQDTKTMIDACANLMREFGSAVLLVHHTGVNEESQHRARGSSAWRAAMDIELSVIPTSDGQRKITQKKVKDGEECEPVFVNLHPVTLPGWLDEDGEPVSSVVPVIGDAPAPPVKKDSKLDSFKKTFDAAWWSSGAEVLDGAPYVSRSGMNQHLVVSMGMSEASAKQYMKPSEPNKVIGALLVSQIIEPKSHGWSVTDPAFASALMIAKNG